ncbi:MAG: hypothetical protein KDK25_09405 [Leptospiraceae bacterium]|nr:hypothetical protein [Leptospiraceae bacterium]
MRRGYLAALTFLFLWSTVLSAPTFTRPLDLRHDWLTAHTSISLQYMYECGPFRNLGASVLFLPSRELGCDAPTRVQNPGKRIYLSYPSGWLLTYLPFYSAFRFLLPPNIPDYQIVRGLALLLIRLPLLAFLLIMMQKQLMVYPGLSPPRALGFSFLANLTFACSPAFLHYTQNIVFTDMIVLPVIYGSMVLFLHRIGKTENAIADETWTSRQNWTAAAAFGLLLWLASSTDWYGALWSAFFLLILWLKGREARLDRYMWLLVASGPAVAALHFGLQVSLLPGGWEQILSTATERTGQNVAGFSQRWHLWQIALTYWTFDLPLPIGWANSFLPFALLILCALTCVLLLRNGGGLSFGSLLLPAPFLVGLLHLIILPQHSAEHDFSALKFGPMILFACFLTVSFLLRVLNDSPLIKGRLSGNTERWALAGLTLLALFAAPTLRANHKATAGLEAVSVEHLNMAALPERLPDSAIPITLATPRSDGYTPLEATGWDPPQSLALAGREIYTPDRIVRYREALGEQGKRAPVVLLAFKPDQEYPCEWKSTGLDFQEGMALLCSPGWTLNDFIRSRKFRLE